MRDRGFALLLVLWSLVLLTLITTRLVAGGRAELRLAGNLRAAAEAEMLADAGVHEAMFHVLDPNQGWPADRAPHSLALPGGAVTLRIDDQSGLVNPNTANEPLLAALLRAVGADAATARGVAAAVLDWRAVAPEARPFGAKAPEYRAAGRPYAPPQAPFRSLDELGLVLGVTPALLDRLRPHLTLFHEGDVNATAATPLVLQALRTATGQAAPPGNGLRPRTVGITAAAEASSGGRFTRRAILRLGLDGTRPYRLLEWQRVEG